MVSTVYLSAQDRGMTFPSVGSLLKITPQPQVITWTRDVHSNSVAVADFGPDPATELVIRSESALEHDDDSPPDFSLDARAVNFHNGQRQAILQVA